MNKCANTCCDNKVTKPGELCAECKKQEKKQDQQKWKSDGWTRYDERDWQSNHHKAGR